MGNAILPQIPKQVSVPQVEPRVPKVKLFFEK